MYSQFVWPVHATMLDLTEESAFVQNSNQVEYTSPSARFTTPPPGPSPRATSSAVPGQHLRGSHGNDS